MSLGKKVHFSNQNGKTENYGKANHARPYDSVYSLLHILSS